MKKATSWINKNIKNIIIIYLYLNPFIDIFTSISTNVLNFSISAGIIIRVFFLIIFTIIFLTTKNNKKSFIYLSVITIYIISFVINVLLSKGNGVLMYELSNTFRTFYFSILIIILFNLNDEKIDEHHLLNVMMIYMIMLIIPALTDTSFEAYTQGKIGEVGWFNSANEISAILSILYPIGLYLTLKSNTINKIIYAALTLPTFFVLGTKMTVITIILTLGIYFIYKAIKDIKSKEYKNLTLSGSILIFAIIAGIIFIPKTNFFKNIEIHLNYLEITNNKEIFAKENLDHFIFSSRLTFLKNTKDNYKQSNFIEKQIGIGYIENYGQDDLSLKTIEMDFFDIYYRHGKIGFLIYVVVITHFIYLAVKISLEKYKQNQLKEISYLISIFLILFISTLVGHVLTAPSVSTIITIIILNKVNERRESK